MSQGHTTRKLASDPVLLRPLPHLCPDREQRRQACPTEDFTKEEMSKRLEQGQVHHGDQEKGVVDVVVCSLTSNPASLSNCEV